jgi:hypothetical protein
MLLVLLFASPALADYRATIEWPPGSSNEDGFRVERKTGSGGTFAEVGITPAGVMTIDDPGPLTEGTEYCWRVVAFNGGGEAVGLEACEAPPITPPMPPGAPTITFLPATLPPEASAGPPTPGLLPPGEGEPPPGPLPDPPEAEPPTGPPAPPP